MRATSYFEGVRQTEIDCLGNNVKLPIFYYDGEAVTGVFPAKLKGLRKMMPDRRLQPARLAPGIGAIAIGCFEYRDSDVGTYNELAISVPLNVPHHKANLPGRSMLGSAFTGQFNAWVHHLPVTTELALIAGRELWNYPKFVAAIDFDQDERTRTCRLAEGAEHILTLKADRLRGGGDREVQLFTHLYQDRQPQCGEFRIHAPRFAQSIKRGAATLELGERHPIARELRDVLLSTQSIASTYAPQMEAILFGPEHISPVMIQRVADSEHEHAGAASA